MEGMYGYESTNHPTSSHRPFAAIPDAQTRREEHLSGETKYATEELGREGRGDMEEEEEKGRRREGIEMNKNAGEGGIVSGRG